MSKIQVIAVKPDEKLFINLPEGARREDVDMVADVVGDAMKDSEKRVIVGAGCEIYIIKPETKIVVDKSKLVEMLKRL